MNHFPRHYLAVVLAAACPAVFADDVEEVVVTASPFAKIIEAVNKPVNLLSGESLQHASASTLGETLNGQLGVSSASFGPGVGLPIIRGQSDNRVKVMQDSVGSMDASAASPDHAVTLEPLLANKIEVLRGPAALRYGSGAIGGVVNVLDNRIPSELPDGIEGGAELRNASVNKLDNNYGVPPDGDELVRIDMHQTRYDVKGELNNPFNGFQKISARLGHNDYEHTEMENGVAGTKFTNNAYEGRVELIHNPIDFSGADWNGAIGIQAAKSTFAAMGDEAFIPKSDINSVGVFIVEETKHNHWTYELGLRTDIQKISPTFDQSQSKGNSTTHDTINLSATTTWHFTEDQQFSLGIAQSQRAPSVEELLANGPHPATGSYLMGDESLREETSTNIEFGYHWHHDNFQFSTNVF
ncbi:MAG: TonB-dependent receptor, partial [Moraxellaceae bacterium]